MRVRRISGFQLALRDGGLMVASAFVFLTLGLAAPASALAQSSYPELAECAQAPIGDAGACSVGQAQAALDMLEPEWGYRLRDSAGVDAFAIVSILGGLQQGLAAFSAGDCATAEEIAYDASEIWTWYVSPRADMTDQGAIDLATVQGFMDQTVSFLSNPREGACP